MPKELPVDPSLENLKNQAKALLKSHRRGLSEATSRIQEFHPEWSRRSVEQVQHADISLSDAQWVIAREYGFDSWAKLKHYVESRKHPAIILIVDKKPEHVEREGYKAVTASIRAYSHVLEREGYKILTASNGAEALETARGARPDMVLLDTTLPDIDGFEVCRRLKADKITANTPVIFVTADWGTQYAVEAFRSGAADYLTQPLAADELRARVKIHLGTKD